MLNPPMCHFPLAAYNADIVAGVFVRRLDVEQVDSNRHFLPLLGRSEIKKSNSALARARSLLLVA